MEQIIDPQRIERYAKTVNLQLEVATVICKSLVCASRQFDSVPTLFGADKERLDVIALTFDANDCLEKSVSLLMRYSKYDE